MAGLIALSAAPAVWARALRLTRRRLELLTPMDAREAAADRDHVRAQAALAVARAEQALAGERDRRARRPLEIGRKAAPLAALEDHRAQLSATLAEREAELRRASADAIEAIGTQGAYAQMTASAEAMRDLAMEERQATARTLAAASALSESRRIAVATLETRALSDRVALDAANEAGARLRAALAERTRDAEKLAHERMFLKEELARAETSRQQLAQRHAALTERLAQIEGDLISARNETRRVESQLLRAKDASDADAARADEAQASLDAAHVRLKEHGAIAQEREARLSDRLEEARAEAAALRGALEEARRARAPAREGDAELRALIAQIGRVKTGEPPPSAAPEEAPAADAGPVLSGGAVADPLTEKARRAPRPHRRSRAKTPTNVTHHGGEAG